jgi:hypothetical protein
MKGSDMGMQEMYPSVAVRDELGQARALVRLALDRTACARGYRDPAKVLPDGSNRVLASNAETAHGEVGELLDWFEAMLGKERSR